MVDRNAQVGWTDGQWNRVQQAINEEANRARVAGSFLALHGPLPTSTNVVPRERIEPDNFEAVDLQTLELIEISVDVPLDAQQVADDQLSYALGFFRRAANILARLEDWIIFNGAPKLETAPEPTDDYMRESQRPYQGFVEKRHEPGPLQSGRKRMATAKHLKAMNPTLKLPPIYRVGPLPQANFEGILSVVGGQNLPLPYRFGGRAMVRGLARAVMLLEDEGHLGPYACVLGSTAFVNSNTPVVNSLVMPRDQIQPLLGQDLMRSATIHGPEFDWVVEEKIADEDATTAGQRRGGQRAEPTPLPDCWHGVVISLAGSPIELVVATDMTAQFVAVTGGPLFRFRVFERFALRIKQPRAIARLCVLPETENGRQSNPDPAIGRPESA